MAMGERGPIGGKTATTVKKSPTLSQSRTEIPYLYFLLLTAHLKVGEEAIEKDG
ncbi:hypothetical protein Golax_005363 [Gossypium laxum]|uniref:Uncharacterized protein n=1 Tax=Gossypium laxum TaxID=34288 RepID=A0A7J9A0I1_9ROSI|nr:hypothetical protein [Gossypium laxum]